MDINYLPTANELLQLIQDILSGNNQKIQQGTKFLKAYTKKVECVQVLLQFIDQCQDQGIRQFCIVLLKRNIVQLYQKVDVNTQQQVKKIVLDRFFNETQNNLKNTVGSLIGNIASVTVENEQWPELFQVIAEKTMNKDQKNKKDGLQLLGNLIESSGSYLEKYYSEFMKLFKETIQRGEDKKVRQETLKNIMYLFENLDMFSKEQKEQGKELIGPIFDCFMECVKENDEDLGVLTLESMHTVVETSNLMDQFIKEIVIQLSDVSILKNRNISMNIRQGFLDLLMTIVEHKKKIMNKNTELIEKLIQSLIEIVNEPITEEDCEENGESIQDIAVQLIENISMNLQKKQVYPIVMKCVEFLLKSNNTNQINTGYLVMAAIVEGCADKMRKHLDVIMSTYIKSGLECQLQEVKGPAIKLLCQLSEFLSPDILVYHKIIMQGLLTSISLDGNLKNNKVNEKALIALDVLIENMDKDQIMFHIQTVMLKLNEVIKSNLSTGFMKQLSMSCIGSVVASSGILFKQYAVDLAGFLHIILNESMKLQKMNEDQISLVCETVMVLGRIAFYVCRDSEIEEQEQQYLDQQLMNVCIYPVMDGVFGLLQKEDECQLRECALTFFYNIADAIGGEFSGIEKVTEIAMQIAESNKGVNYLKDKKQDEFSLDTDSEDENTSSRVVNVKIAFMDEKAAAIHALGTFANVCHLKFTPYYPRLLAILDQNYSQFYDNIRVQTVNSYMNLAFSMVKAINQGRLPNKQQRISMQYNQQIDEFIQIDLFNKFLYYLEEDTSSDVVCSVLESLESLILKLGRPFMGNNLDNLVQNLINSLKGKTKCLNQEDNENDIDIDEVKGDIFEIITDIIPALNKIFKDQFNPYFDKLFKTMYQFLDLENDVNFVLQMIGAFAESFKTNPGLITVYGSKVGEFLLNESQKFEDEEIDRNAVFCLGVMCEKNPMVMSQYFVQIMNYLKIVYEKSKMPECKDNIIAAFCKMIMGDSSKVPLFDQIIVHTFQNVPFKADLAEYKSILRFYIYLCQFQQQYAQQFLQQISQAFIEAIHQQRKYSLSQKFVSILIQKLTLLIQNSPQTKSIVESYLNSIQDLNQQNQLKSLF